MPCIGVGELLGLAAVCLALVGWWQSVYFRKQVDKFTPGPAKRSGFGSPDHTPVIDFFGIYG